MSAMKKLAVAMAVITAGVVVLAGCDGDSNYDQRTVVYVSSINEGAPYLCDVLNQGDSLYYNKTTVFKIEDDYIVEDKLLVEIHNRPYNGLVDTRFSLGDFLVTGYDVVFERTDGGTELPVNAFSGDLSLLVPADSKVNAQIVICPYYYKTVDPLVSMQYTNQEIFTNATVNFYGHEVQTDRDITFTAGIQVNFADPLLTKTQTQ